MKRNGDTISNDFLKIIKYFRNFYTVQGTIVFSSIIKIVKGITDLKIINFFRPNLYENNRYSILHNFYTTCTNPYYSCTVMYMYLALSSSRVFS